MAIAVADPGQTALREPIHYFGRQPVPAHQCFALFFYPAAAQQFFQILENRVSLAFNDLYAVFMQLVGCGACRRRFDFTSECHQSAPVRGVGDLVSNIPGQFINRIESCRANVSAMGSTARVITPFTGRA